MKRLITFAFVLCLGTLMLAACGKSGSGGSASIPENPGDVYRVIVCDESDSGVQGVKVQFCSDTMCLIGVTDVHGVAIFDDQEQGIYSIHIQNVPEGYEKNTAEYTSPEVYGDIYIILKASE